MSITYNDDFRLYKLNEVSMMRLIGPHAQSGYVGISAWDNEGKSLAENKRNHESLRADIKKHGFSYANTYGGYKYPEGRVDLEQSYLVFPFIYKNGEKIDVPFEELKDFALQMCGKYDQHSVLIKGEGDAIPVYLDRNGNKVNKRASNLYWLDNLKKEAFTSLKKGKRSVLSGNDRITLDVDFGDDNETTDAPMSESENRVFIGAFVRDVPAGYTDLIRRVNESNEDEIKFFVGAENIVNENCAERNDDRTYNTFNKRYNTNYLMDYYERDVDDAKSRFHGNPMTVGELIESLHPDYVSYLKSLSECDSTMDKVPEDIWVVKSNPTHQTIDENHWESIREGSSVPKYKSVISGFNYLSYLLRNNRLDENINVRVVESDDLYNIFQGM